jgi:hypothetical protein
MVLGSLCFRAAAFAKKGATRLFTVQVPYRFVKQFEFIGETIIKACSVDASVSIHFEWRGYCGYSRAAATRAAEK